MITLGLLGDIAVPDSVDGTDLGGLQLPGVDLTLANLEGPVRPSQPDQDWSARSRGGCIRLYSSADGLQRVLQASNVACVSLANNHILDLGTDLHPTLEFLDRCGIAYSGAGQDLPAAQRPAHLRCAGYEVVVLAFGWKVIGAQAAGRGRPGVNPLTWRNAVDCVDRARAAYPDALVICTMHWNYELELYPQPAHREMAFALVDHGADVVVGHHSHVVQGIELHDGKPILYGLGNWFLPRTGYVGGALSYPPQSDCQVMAELRFGPGRRLDALVLHWFDFCPRAGSLTYRQSEPLDQSTGVRVLTPYAGLSADAYVRWFRKYRTRRTLLPVYRRMGASLENSVKDWVVGVRQQCIRGLLRLGVVR